MAIGRTNAVSGGTGGDIDLNNVNAYPVDYTKTDDITVYIGVIDISNRVIRGGQEG